MSCHIIIMHAFALTVCNNSRSHPLISGSIYGAWWGKKRYHKIQTDGENRLAMHMRLKCLRHIRYSAKRYETDFIAITSDS